MNFLDVLKERYPAAQKRAAETAERFQFTQRLHQSATQQMQAAQAEYNTAVAEMNSIQTLINSEMRRIAQEDAERKAAEANQASAIAPAEVVSQSAATEPTPVDDKTESTEINKSELIRDALRAHPNGLTPAEVWRLVKDQIPRRSYVYAVLARLVDREQVAKNRKGKYYFRNLPKPEDVKEQAMQQVN